MKNQIKLRIASPNDAKELRNIYAPYVKKTAITFEYDVPTVKEFKNRIKTTLENYPYIEATIKDEIVGYAYLGRFKARRAYDWVAETSIYVKEDFRGRGIGKILYEAIEKIAKSQGIVTLYACVTNAEKPDEYQNNMSVGFHEYMGYKKVGTLKKCGYKFNRWYSMTIFSKNTAGKKKDMKPFISFSKLDVKDIIK
ncbi:MAG: GNAT family N-acetyltransferase [Clostridiales bacterium]|nr:GNAT family N-acetyltransferase [Clostridiales bacterium]